MVEQSATQLGWDHAKNGGKLKENPYAAGSIEWWAWHNSYNKSKKILAAVAREQQYAARTGRKSIAK